MTEPKVDSDGSWFAGEPDVFSTQKSYQQRFDNFRDAMLKWINETKRPFADLKQKDTLRF